MELINQNNNTQNKRVYFLDVLRAAACLSVIMIHASSDFMVSGFGSVDFWIACVFNTLSRIAIPSFVMISGSIFLDENYHFTTKKLIGHIKKILVFFIFWSVLYSLYYYVYFPLRCGQAVQIQTFVEKAITGHYHLWFCFMIIGLYLIVPFLRLWVKKENIKEVKYFIILSLIIFMFIPNLIEMLSVSFPNIAFLNSIINDLNLSYIGGYTVYFILGWYLNNYEIKHEKILFALGITGVIFSILMTNYFSVRINSLYIVADVFSLQVAFQSISAFVFAKKKHPYSNESKNILQKAVSLAAKYSMGIYAVHPFMLRILDEYVIFMNINCAALEILFKFSVGFILSLMISYIMGKIPIIKKVV